MTVFLPLISIIHVIFGATVENRERVNANKRNRQR